MQVHVGRIRSIPWCVRRDHTPFSKVMHARINGPQCQTMNDSPLQTFDSQNAVTVIQNVVHWRTIEAKN